MAASYPVRSFGFGELSDLYASRVDTSFYAQGCRVLENMFPLPVGPAEKRSGTIYSNTAKTAGRAVVLIPWILSSDEAIVMEVGHNYIRYYKNGVQIENLGSPVETSTTYTEAELCSIRVAQILGYMYIVHPAHAPAKLTRATDISWTLSTPVTFLAGAGEESFASSGHFPSHVEIYEDRLIFARTDLKTGTFWGSRVGQYEDFRLTNSATVTTPIASPGVVNWTAHGLIDNASVVFNTTGALPTGLASGVVYYVVGASIAENTFQVSATPGGAAINFTGATSGTHTADNSPPLATNAWEKTPYVKKNNDIRWLLAEDALLFGTSDGPYRVGGKEVILTGDVAWWPRKQASMGCSTTQALMVDDFAAFVGKDGKSVYRFQFDQDDDKYIPEDITTLADHIGGTGIIGLVHQRYPKTIMWGWTADGDLISATYSRVMQTLGWSRHDVSGLVESATVIPTSGEDQLWLSVNRTIGGSPIRHIEYTAPQKWTNIEDYHGVDSAVVVDNGAAKTVTSISNATPAVCVATAHGFLNDEKVLFKDVTLLTAVNGAVYTVKNRTADDFELYTEDGSTAIDFSGEASAGAGGTVEKVTNIVTGLSHLNGLTVKTLGDGSVIADEVVAAGQVTLDEYANKIRTGLGFTAVLEPMDIAEAQNKKKRVVTVWASFYRTGDAQVGPDEDTMTQVTFDGLPTMDDPPDAFSESEKILFKGYAGYKGRVRIQSENPLPLTVRSMIYEVEVP